MVQTTFSQYDALVGTLSELLATNLRRLRQRHVGTQEQWEEVTHMHQPSLSRYERGKGFTVLDRIEEALERAGIDPRDLFALQPEDDGAAEVLQLWRVADDEIRQVVRVMLRRAAERSQESERSA